MKYLIKKYAFYNFDCLTFALLCGIDKIGGNVIPILINKYHFYNIQKKIPNVIQKSTYFLSNIQSYLNVTIKTIKFQDNCIQIILDALKKNGLVIVLTNDYYNPLRVDTYLKEHKPHHILIYGANVYSEIFQIIESNHRYTVNYQTMEISFSNLMTSQKYTKRHELILLFPKYQSKCRKCHNIDNYIVKKCFNKQKHELYKSIKNLETYEKQLKKVIYDNTEINDWLEFFNNICNIYKTYIYIDNIIFHNSQLNELTNSIYRKWYLLRIEFVKCIRKKHLMIVLNNILNEFNIISKQEIKRIDFIKKLINKE